MNNNFPRSAITEEVNGTSVGRPFVYEGEFVDGLGSCQSRRATVTLKDGTCRVGPWKKGRPKGNWWNDKKHPPMATSTALSGSISQEEEKEEPLEQERPAKRARRESSELEDALVVDSKPASREPALRFQN